MTCGYRDFPGRRWLIVVLRAAHLAGVVGVGAALLGAPPAASGAFTSVLVLSGVLMALLDAWSNPQWLRELAGVSLLLKLALLIWFAADDTARPALFWTILIFSVLFSHAPASFRHRQI